MKVAIIHSAWGRFGGAEKMSILHGLHLERLGIDVELFYGGPIPEEWRRKVVEKVPFRRLPFALDVSMDNLSHLIWLPKKLNSFDVVLFYYHVDPFVAYMLVKRLDTKKIWYCGEPLRALWEDRISGMSIKELRWIARETTSKLYSGPVSKLFLSDPLYGLSMSILRKLDVKTALSFDRIIANSRYTEGVVKKVYGITENVNVVYPGVDVDGFKGDNANDFDPPIKSNYVLAIGPFHPVKNYENLIRAYGKLPLKLRERVKLVIIGEGPLKEQIKDLAQGLNVAGDLIMHGFVSEAELIRYYANCEFLVHIGLHEPFGLIPVEGAFFGKPSVVSEVGGTGETVLHGEAGLLVDPEDPREIAAAVKALIEDEELRRDMGSKAKRRTLSKFTIEKSSEGLAKVLKSVVGETP